MRREEHIALLISARGEQGKHRGCTSLTIIGKMQAQRNHKTIKSGYCDVIESDSLWHLHNERGRGLVRYGDGLQRSLRPVQMMINGSTELFFLQEDSKSDGIMLIAVMTRWSTDACRRDPSIVSSNLTDPTFSHRFSDIPQGSFQIQIQIQNNRDSFPATTYTPWNILYP